MAEDEKKKSLLDKALDALTDRDEKQSAAKAAAEKIAAEKATVEKAAAEKAAAAKAAAERVAAAEKASAVKAAAEKVAAAEREAARDVAAAKAAAEKAAAEKEAAQEKVAAHMAAAAKAAAERKAVEPKKGVVKAHKLYIRADHDDNAKAVGGLESGNEVTIYETWSDGKNSWANIGEGKWSAMVYDGKTYIEVAKTAEEIKAAEAEAARALASAKKGIVQVRSLFIRQDHDAKAKAVGGLEAGKEVAVYETWTDGKNTWARIGEGQWSAMIYNGETYIKLAE